MIYKKLEAIPEILAGDHTHLKEVLHPKNDQLQIDFSLAYAYLKKGEKSLPHQLTNSETYYFLEGKGEIHVNGISQSVKKNDIIFVPPNAEQFVSNSGEIDLKFLCIVSPPWSAESEEINHL